MQIDINTLIIGILIGAVIAFLIRMERLKSISLDLKKLGIALGVEGFDKKESPSGVTIGDISGSTVGDVAGRDINKNSFVYKTMQAAAREAVKSVLADPVSDENFDGVRLQRTIRIESKTRDPKLKAKLKNTMHNNDGWLNDYYLEYFGSSELLEEIKRRKKELAKDGWRLVAVRPLDNITDGVLVEFVAEKMI